MIGRISISEIFTLFLFFLLNLRGIFSKYASLLTMCKYLFLFLFIQIVSDIYNEVKFVDFSRGWAVIIFSILSTLTLVYLFNKTRVNVILFLSTIILLNLFFVPDIFNFETNPNFFKTRIIGFLNPTIVLLSIYFTKNRHTHIPVLLFIIYSLFSFYFDGRSNGIIFFIGAILLFFSKKKIKPLNFFVVILLSFSISYLFFISYVKAVDSNLITGANSIQQISKMSNIYNPFELITLGRAEVFIAFNASIQKPLLGYGSWAKDVGGIFNLALAELNGHVSTSESDFIPAHSLLLGAFLYAGFFGFLSILFLMFLFFKIFFNNYFKAFDGDYFAPLYIYLFSDMLWAMIFSPFGLLRTTFPFFAAVFIVYCGKSKKYEISS
jgi:hypothetical protein